MVVEQRAAAAAVALFLDAAGRMATARVAGQAAVDQLRAGLGELGLEVPAPLAAEPALADAAVNAYIGIAVRMLHALDEDLAPLEVLEAGFRCGKSALLEGLAVSALEASRTMAGSRLH